MGGTGVGGDQELRCTEVSLRCLLDIRGVKSDRGFPSGSMVKNPPASVGAARDTGLIPGLGRSPGEGNGSLLQYSYPDNP